VPVRDCPTPPIAAAARGDVAVERPAGASARRRARLRAGTRALRALARKRPRRAL